MKINRQFLIVTILVAQGCTSSSGMTKRQVLAEFNRLVDSSATPCPQKPDCFCKHFETQTSLPLRFSLAQYCPLPSGKRVSFDSWDEKGNKVDQGAYVNGKMQGQWISWHPNGQISARSFYDHGVQNGPITNWHENGQISLSGQYVNGKEDGQWVFYSTDGKVIRQLVWKSGKLVSKAGG
jgi:MORN repeat protein